MNNVKIAISGASGIGKTTLAKALAEKFKVSYIPENCEEIFESLDKFKKTIDPLKKKHYLDDFIEHLNTWLKYRYALCKDIDGFVMDRCVFDAILFVILQPLFDHNNKAILNLIHQATEFSKSIDCIIIPPLSSWMDQEKVNESGLIRNNSFRVKLHTQSFTIGLLEQYCCAQKIYLNSTDLTLEDRLVAIDQHLSKFTLSPVVKSKQD